jgi:hypothetical protein
VLFSCFGARPKNLDIPTRSSLYAYLDFVENFSGFARQVLSFLLLLLLEVILLLLGGLFVRAIFLLKQN